MKRILEVPVFVLKTAHLEKVFPGEELLEARMYNDFKLLEIELGNDYRVFLYIIQAMPEMGNASLIDQIIPKVPFGLFVLDLNEGLDKTALGEMFQTYIRRYATPAYFIAPKDELEQKHLRFNNEPLIVNNNSHLFVYDPQDNRAINKILAKAIKVRLELQQEKEGS